MNFEIFFLRGESGGQAAQSCDSCPQICLFCLDLITPSANYRYRREIEKVKSNYIHGHSLIIVDHTCIGVKFDQVQEVARTCPLKPPI